MKWALAPHVATVAGTRAEAMRQFKSNGGFRIILLDLGLPPDQDGASEGLKTLEEILVASPRTKVIVVSGNADRANAVKAVGKGAFDFIQKPIDIDVLKLVELRPGWGQHLAGPLAWARRQPRQPGSHVVQAGHEQVPASPRVSGQRAVLVWHEEHLQRPIAGQERVEAGAE